MPVEISHRRAFGLAIGCVLLCAVFGLVSGGMPTAPENIVELAQENVPLVPLRDKCEIDTREEKRLWLVDDQDPHYVLVLFAGTDKEGVRGNFVEFSDCAQPDTSSPADRCNTKVLDSDAANWVTIYSSIADWRNTDASFRAPGSNVALSVFVESCHEGVYDTYIYADGTEEAEAVSGIVISVAELLASVPAN